MSEKSKRLTSEEIWATALAVVGGLAVLVPLIAFSIAGQEKKQGGDERTPPALAGGDPGRGDDVPKAADLPIPESEEDLKKELVAARLRIDSLGGELAGARSESEKNLRSAERAWKQLRAAGEFGEGSPIGQPES